MIQKSVHTAFAALILLAIMMLGYCTLAEEAVASGDCGDNLTWQLDSAGVLTISGEGAMTNYESDSSMPWYSSLKSIQRVVLSDGVTSIGSYAFYSCSNLTSVSIPDSLSAIGNYAFFNCTLLDSVAFPEGISIGAYAFSDCFGLTELTIPAGSYVDTSAFDTCSGLISVTFCEGGAVLGSSTFENCYNLTAVYAPDLESWLSIQFENLYSNPLNYAGNLYIGGELLVNAVIPESISTIGRYAFRGCSSLRSISIPDSVNIIEGSAFAYCANLSEVSFPKGLVSIGSLAFGYCGSLTEIALPNTLTSIGSLAFSSCTGLTSIAIPDSVVTIDEGAFRYCSHLTKVTLPKNLTAIPSNLFERCESLPTVSIPASVSSIGYGAFKYCASLIEIDLPEGLKLIDESTFERCTSLKSISIPESVTSINQLAFTSCTSLSEVTLFEGLKTISSSAFNGCSALTSLVIPDSVTSFGSYAFAGCKGLKYLWIVGSDMPTVGSYAFSSCSPTVYCLKSSRAYSWASGNDYDIVCIDGLTAPWVVGIPTECMLEVGQTSALTVQLFPAQENPSVQWTSSAPEIASVQDGVITAKNYGTATITASCGSAYAECIVTVKLPAHFILPSALTVIESEAFAGSDVEEVILDGSCTSIGNRAFADCTALERIVIPNDVIFIADDAFEGCKNLTFVCSPDSNAAAYAEIHGFACVSE